MYSIRSIRYTETIISGSMFKIRRIWSSHSGGYEEVCLLSLHGVIPQKTELFKQAFRVHAYYPVFWKYRKTLQLNLSNTELPPNFTHLNQSAYHVWCTQNRKKCCSPWSYGNNDLKMRSFSTHKITSNQTRTNGKGGFTQWSSKT
jgi:hypothetical protein